MNHIHFGNKQVYLGTVRYTRALLAPYGITPARYNMLTAIAKHRRGLAQVDLRGILGVTAATISRMLRSLEELRLIFRTLHPHHARHRWIAITELGALRLGAAIVNLIDSGEIGWMTAEMLNPTPGSRATAAHAIADVDAIYVRARAALNDHATLWFDYDDFERDAA